MKEFVSRKRTPRVTYKVLRPVCAACHLGYVHRTPACTRSAGGIAVTTKTSGGQGTLLSFLVFLFDYGGTSKSATKHTCCCSALV